MRTKKNYSTRIQDPVVIGIITTAVLRELEARRPRRRVATERCRLIFRKLCTRGCFTFPLGNVDTGGQEKFFFYERDEKKKNLSIVRSVLKELFPGFSVCSPEDGRIFGLYFDPTQESPD